MGRTATRLSGRACGSLTSENPNPIGNAYCVRLVMGGRVCWSEKRLERWLKIGHEPSRTKQLVTMMCRIVLVSQGGNRVGS